MTPEGSGGDNEFDKEGKLRHLLPGPPKCARCLL